MSHLAPIQWLPPIAQNIHRPASSTQQRELRTWNREPNREYTPPAEHLGARTERAFHPRRKVRATRRGLGLVLVAVLVAAACAPDPERERLRNLVEAVYDEETGRLSEITYDSDQNGTIDTWTYMDGTRVLRAEID